MKRTVSDLESDPRLLTDGGGSGGGDVGVGVAGHNIIDIIRGSYYDPPPVDLSGDSTNNSNGIIAQYHHHNNNNNNTNHNDNTYGMLASNTSSTGSFRGLSNRMARMKMTRTTNVNVPTPMMMNNNSVLSVPITSFNNGNNNGNNNMGGGGSNGGGGGGNGCFGFSFGNAFNSNNNNQSNIFLSTTQNQNQHQELQHFPQPPQQTVGAAVAATTTDAARDTSTDNAENTSNDNDNTNQIVNEMERLTVKELNTLSLQEREFVYDDIHGVAQPIEESDKFIQDKLKQLDTKLQEMVQRSSSSTTSSAGVGVVGNTTTASSSSSSSSLSSTNDNVISSYLYVQQTTPERVTSPSFQLMFLRADLFDVTKAAQRIIDFYYAKQQIWGKSRLCRDITYQDLELDDRKALESGCMQLNPQICDRAGRAILLLSETHKQFKTLLNRFRIFWYLAMKALQEDVNVQKRGIVHVNYNVYNNKTSSSGGIIDPTFLELVTKLHLIQCVPFRFSSVHFCFNSPLLRQPMALIQRALTTNHRLRIRSHYGTDMEVQYELQAFGISKDNLPLDENGNLHVDRHLAYLEQCRQKERQQLLQQQQSVPSSVPSSATTTTAATATTSSGLLGNTSESSNGGESAASASRTTSDSGKNIIQTPTRNDVLLGRGKTIQEHPGNIQLSNFVEKYRTQYLAAQFNVDKSCIIQLIVKLIHEQDGRFLQFDKKLNGWIEVTDEVAWHKVSRRYRK